MRRIGLATVLVVVLAACGAAGDSADGGGEAGGAKDAAVAAKAGTLGRATIRTADLTVHVDDVDAAARGAVRTAESHGGYLEAEESRDGRTRVTLRVPPEDFTATIDAVARLGTTERRTVSTQDVTNDVADVAGRLEAARASVTRVRDLMGRAATLAEVANVESELNEREAALESLETRQRTLAGQTSFATVTALFAKAPAAPPQPVDAGFTGGLRGGWRAFTWTVSALLVVVGVLLPFAGAAAVVGVPLYALRRRRISARA